MKQLSATELAALPERPATADRVVQCTDRHTGLTTCFRIPRRFVVNDSDTFSFFDGEKLWLVGKDEEGFFKYSV